MVTRVMFEEWLAGYLKWEKPKVAELMRNKTVFYFLISWSLFEERLFGKNAQKNIFKRVAEDLVKNENFSRVKLERT